MTELILKLDIRGDEFKERTHKAVLDATTDVFELDIKARAKELSPVSDANPKIGDGKYRPTGNNKNSIDAEVVETDEGVNAKLFTQSGYGGYLEVGTSKMEARPYMFPAFDEFVGTIPARTKEKLNG
jgi:HK97 gp10 family phage protein